MAPAVQRMLDDTVTFETKCWEGDWRRILSPGHLDELIGRFDRKFDEKRLIVNNVDDRREVDLAARPLLRRGIVDGIVYVEDEIERALSRFGLDTESFGEGYWYSTAEIVGIATCGTGHLVHVAGDVAMAQVADWVTQGVRCLESDRSVKAVNPVWNGQVREALLEEQSRNGAYSIGQGFTDQCYLISVEAWADIDLKLDHPQSGRYPAYGGRLFERRVDSWLRTNGFLRATDLRVAYIHPIH
ncbi:MAG: hypothetical protein JSS66_08560 [Armatimonadetes bacterium]|nr:hypothetical protein [Armatimonadota bacterium]